MAINVGDRVVIHPQNPLLSRLEGVKGTVTSVYVMHGKKPRIPMSVSVYGPDLIPTQETRISIQMDKYGRIELVEDDGWYEVICPSM